MEFKNPQQELEFIKKNGLKQSLDVRLVLRMFDDFSGIQEFMKKYDAVRHFTGGLGRKGAVDQPSERDREIATHYLHSYSMKQTGEHFGLENHQVQSAVRRVAMWDFTASKRVKTD